MGTSEDELFPEDTPHGRSTRAPAMGCRGMVASGHPYATQAGLDVLKDGGNAFDAIVAVAATLNVVEPYMSGVGGVGIALIYDAKSGQSRVLNFSGRAPGAAVPEAFDARSKAFGTRAPLVPGNLAGWATLHREYGALPWRRCFRDAIAHADDGYPLTPFAAAMFRANWGLLTEYGELRAHFLGGNDVPPNTGDRFRQPDLARTLRTIAAQGTCALYEGDLAVAMADTLQRAGGLISRQDLACYAPEWQAPLSVPYRGHDICLPAPNCSAFQIAQTLRMLDLCEGLDYARVSTMHQMLEAIKLAIADRIRWAGDPDFTDIPLDRLLSAEHAIELRRRIDPSQAAAPPEDLFSEGYRDVEHWWRQGMTTHFVSADAQGNVAAISQTLGNVFGCGVVVPGTGILLNNMALWFDIDPCHPSPNRIAPRKRVDFCLSPCHVMQSGKPKLSIGTPGSYGILQSTVQVLHHVIDAGMNVQEAIEAPRFRLMESGEVLLEARYPGHVERELQALGHRARRIPQAWSRLFGGAHGICFGEAGALLGGADPRRDGIALGW